jgi:hypothetical protein
MEDVASPEDRKQPKRKLASTHEAWCRLNWAWSGCYCNCGKND